MSKSILLGLLATFSALSSYGVPVYATTSGNTLLQLDSATPGTIASSVVVSGLQSGENLLGIDFRPATGGLYGIGSTNRLYTINTTTGAATQVGVAGLFTLSGTLFGVDFNPTVDRIRVTSNTGQNLRLNPNDGTLLATDGNLAYAAGDPNFGSAPQIVGSAYANNVSGAATTTLYDIDLNGLRLVTQNPPNNGTLNTIGSLGVTSTGNIGFDISPAGVAYASLTAVNGTSGLYTINLTTGAATLLGTIGGGGLTVTGLAVGVNPVPEPATISLMLGGLALLLAKRKR